MLTLRVHAARVVAGELPESGMELTVLDGYVFYYVAAVCIGAAHKSARQHRRAVHDGSKYCCIIGGASASSLADDRLIKGFLS